MTNNVENALLENFSDIDISDALIVLKRLVSMRCGAQTSQCWLDLQFLLSDALEKAIACECEESEKPEEEPEDVQIL